MELAAVPSALFLDGAHLRPRLHRSPRAVSAAALHRRPGAAHRGRGAAPAARADMGRAGRGGAAGGRCAYLEQQRLVAAQFTAAFGMTFPPLHNSADVVMDALSQHGAEYADAWQAGRYAQLLRALGEPEVPQTPKPSPRASVNLCRESAGSSARERIHTEPEWLGVESKPAAAEAEVGPESFHISAALEMVDVAYTTIAGCYASAAAALHSLTRRRSSSSPHIAAVPAKRPSVTLKPLATAAADSATEGREGAGGGFVLPPRGASWLRQAVLVHQRSLRAQYASWASLVQEVVVGLAVASIMGVASRSPDRTVYYPPSPLCRPCIGRPSPRPRCTSASQSASRRRRRLWRCSWRAPAKVAGGAGRPLAVRLLRG